MPRDRALLLHPAWALAVSLALLAPWTAIADADLASQTHYRRLQPDHHLVFSDEFNEGALSEEHWTTCYWWDDGGCTNEGNNELQWYLPDQVVVHEGRLLLQARDEQVALEDGRTFPHRSGMVTTGRDVYETTEDPRFTFTYGHVEVRARVPSGSGLWPAVWLLPADHVSRPEIDVMEVLGDTPRTLRMHVHYVDADGHRASLGKDSEGPDLSDAFHTYGLTWTPTELVFWRDGIRLWHVTEPDAIPHEPMYLLINLAVGGDWPGPPGEGSLPADMVVEHVRIWQQDDP